MLTTNSDLSKTQSQPTAQPPVQLPTTPSINTNTKPKIDTTTKIQTNIEPEQEDITTNTPVAENMIELHFGMLLYIVSAFAYSAMFHKTAENIKNSPDGHGVFMFEHDKNIPEQIKADIEKEIETAKPGIDYNNNNLLELLKDNPELLKDNPKLLSEVGLESKLGEEAEE